MKTDRELLELAAKAAGIEGSIHEMLGGGLYVANSKVPLGMWAPLTDDGDALRLAVKLKLDVLIDASMTDVIGAGTDDVMEAESHNDDPYAATRRAIVRAAAAMQEKKS